MEPGVAASTAITVNLLVAGDYDVAAASTEDTHFNGAELRAAVESFGRTLVALPEGWEDDPSTVVTVLQDRPYRPWPTSRSPTASCASTSNPCKPSGSG
jgi:hypothetical protein